MPFSVMWIPRSPDGRGGKQPWQFLDVTLMDFEWWSLTEETPYGTTPSQNPEQWRCLLTQKEFSPNLEFLMFGQEAQGELKPEQTLTMALSLVASCKKSWGHSDKLYPNSHHLPSSEYYLLPRHKCRSLRQPWSPNWTYPNCYFRFPIIHFFHSNLSVELISTPSGFNP